MRLAYVQSPQGRDWSDHASSDSIGYGVTSSGALQAALQTRLEDDLTIVEGGPQAGLPDSPEWQANQLARVVAHVRIHNPEVILVFHASHPDTASMRRCLDLIGYRGKLAAYTHGSHWDPTDTFRSERHPKLRWADLGNLMALDHILCVSTHIRETILSQLSAKAPSAALQFKGKSDVVGLPVAMEFLDSLRHENRAETPTLLFNHSFTGGKAALRFLRALPGVFAAVPDLLVHITRGPLPATEEMRALQELANDNCLVHHGLSREQYAWLLWRCTHQVSVATHETFGVATLEAMAVGVAALAPRAEVYPELLGAVPDCMYDPEADLTPLLAGFLLQDDARRLDLANRQRCLVRTNHTAELVAARILEVVGL
jgi:glycosyltransferase involved in cell wall biosynthesis